MTNLELQKTANEVRKGIVTAEKTYPQAYVFFGDTHMPEAHALHTEKIHKAYHVRAADLQAQESEEAVSGFGYGVFQYIQRNQFSLRPRSCCQPETPASFLRRSPQRCIRRSLRLCGCHRIRLCVPALQAEMFFLFLSCLFNNSCFYDCF